MPARSAAAVCCARWSTSAVKSHSATNVNWAAVESERRMCSAIFRRRPRSGTRVSPAVAAAGFAAGIPPPAAAFTSSAVMRPPGPVPASLSSATPSSLASARTAGVASTRPPAAGAAAATAGLAATAVAPAAACAEAEAAGAAAPPATAMLTSTVPTGTTVPSSTRIDSIVPVRGDGISTLALSVITSTSGWSSFTASPAFTSQRTISPSATPSPMSGSFTSYDDGAMDAPSLHEVEAADQVLGPVDALALAGELLVLVREVQLERLVRLLARPAIGDHEPVLVAHVAHERRAHEPGTLLEQLHPRAVGPVQRLELVEPVGPRHVLPHDHEHDTQYSITRSSAAKTRFASGRYVCSRVYGNGVS